jgi:uncharacterized protein YndB with AHSA1/START domain
MRVDEATRVIQASPSVLYRAFEDPSALESWLPPKGMTGHVLAFDFRDGGSYRMRLVYSDKGKSRGKSSGDTDEVEVRFVRLIKDLYIEQAVTFDSDDPRFSGEMTVAWHFSVVLGGTKVTVRCESVPEGISRDDHQAGLSSSLQNLARFAE